MNIPFKVFPSIGYRNTQFQVVSFLNNLQIQIEYKGQNIAEVNLSNNNTILIRKFEHQGIYTATCIIKGKEFKQKFEIKDAIRLGTSELRMAYTFDNIPFTFFLMMDRMLIYDENKQTLWEENGISPTDIRQIDENYLLLIPKVKNKTEDIIKTITKFDIYSVYDFATVKFPEFENVLVEILHNETKNILWLFNDSEKSIIAYSLENIKENGLKKVAEIASIINYKINKSGTHLYAESNEIISIIDISSAETNTFEKKANTAIDEDGNTFELNNKLLLFNNLETKISTQSTYSVPENFNVSPKRFFFIGKEFINNINYDEFENKVNEISTALSLKLDNTKTNQSITLDNLTVISEESLNYELFPTENGIHIVAQKTVRKLNKVNYSKDPQNNWKVNPYITTTTDYSLFYNSKLINNIIIDYTPYFNFVGYYNSILIIRNDNKNKFIKEGKIIREAKPQNEYSVIALKEKSSKYLIEKTENKFNVFSFINFNAPILSDIEILNLEFIDFHFVIWFSGDQKNTIQDFKYLKGYNLLSQKHISLNENESKHSRYSDAKEFVFMQQYFLTSSKVLVNPFKSEIKDAAFGTIINTSISLNKVITRREENIYFLKYNYNTKKYSEESIVINIEKNKESYLSPNGKYLMLQKKPNKYIFYNIQTDEEIEVFTEKFIAFSKEGNLIFEDNHTRNAKIIDPLTFDDITTPNYHHYRFFSPDGNLYSQLVTTVKYYDKVQEKYIDKETFIKYSKELDFAPFNYGKDKNLMIQEKLKIELNKRIFFESNKSKLNEMGVHYFDKIYLGTVIRIDKFTEIGVVGTNKNLEILFENLEYYNYAAFSYDNKYFGYVGKPLSGGIIHLYKIDFNTENKKLETTNIWISREPEMATWVCGFSKTGYFSTYDSNPHTYILKVEDSLFEQDKVENVLIKKILWKNFLCFSPSGNFLALSEQGYDPYTLGGYGHQESSAIHIAQTSTGKILISFLDHGYQLVNPTYKDTIFVAFSEDETKLMSMSKDGVVIVRNIELKTASEQTKETIADETYASR